MELYITISDSIISNMKQPCVIVIEHKTREMLKDVAKKSQTYDMILKELIEIKNRGEDFKK
jgi:hypothetical protein